MTALVFRGMAQRKLRSALTALAVLLGVAMIAGTFVQTDRIGRAFEDIQRAGAAGTDVIVVPREAFDASFGDSATLDESLVARVAAVEGVARAEGTLSELGSLVVDGRRVDSSFAPTLVVSDVDAPFDAAVEVLAGRDVERAGEIAVNRGLFEDEGLRVGQRVGVSTRSGLQPATVVGSFDFGGGISLGGATVIVAPLEDVQRWYGRDGEVSAVEIAAAEGVSPDVLARAVARVVGRDAEVRTGAENAQIAADQINDEIGGFLTPALLTFAGAALLVGAFIIFNTFSITVAQRTREFGMLRALGATRRQIVVAVVGEAVVIGLAASAAGLLAGLGFAAALGALFDAAGWGIPSSGIVVAARTVVVASAVGVAVTLIAALVPALRATRVPPVAALSDAPPVPTARRRRATAIASLAVAALGMALLARGLFAGGPAEQRLAAVAGGAVVLLVGVALNARHLVRPIARLVGRPIERLFHTPGRLARENAMRNPGRTAATSAALMVGLGLVVFVAVFAAGLKSSVNASLDDLVRADLIILQDGFAPVASGAGDAVAEVPGVAGVSPFYADQIEVDGEEVKATTDTLDGVDLAAIERVYEFDWIGEPADPAALGPGEALVEEQFAEAHGIERGERFSIQTPSGGRGTFRAAGVYEDPQILQGMIVGVETFRRLSSARDPFAFFVAFEPGAEAAAVRRDVERALSRFPGTEAQSQAEYAQGIEDQLNQLVYMLYALLAMSVLISLFGIANSLFLSIHERTREFGLLRAVGATQEQVRRVVRYESVITSVIGGLLGIAVGLLFAGLMTLALSDLGLGFAVPVAQLAAFLVLAVLVGIAGAVVPARRGARVDVLDAIRHE